MLYILDRRKKSDRDLFFSILGKSDKSFFYQKLSSYWPTETVNIKFLLVKIDLLCELWFVSIYIVHICYQFSLESKKLENAD